MRRRASLVLVPLVCLAALAEDPPGEIVPAKWLALDGPDLRARRPVSPNAVFARYLLDRNAAPPKEGDGVTGERGTEVKWRVAMTNGVTDFGSAAWAYAEVESDTDRVVLLRAQGVVTVWVNGEPYAGDVYGYGFRGVPARVAKGTNRVYLQGLRGDVRVAFAPVEAGVLPADWDVSTSTDGGPRGVLLLNTTDGTVSPSVGAGEAAPTYRILPLGVAKVPVESPDASTSVTWAGVTRLADTHRGLRAAGAPSQVTRISEIDGSVQEYAVVEPAPSLVAAPTRVVLSLHGASVPCMNQAKSYSRRPGVWIVCPTNRRPYGFDWQDWGRLDAYEALEHFGAARGIDVAHVCLTGHSMGGHGTWHLAANDPDRFVAIAPSAGWPSFDTYIGPRPPTPLAAIWRGADGSSDTLALVKNLAPLPTLVVHGTKDDNVPLAQADTILEALRTAGGDPQAHFQKDADHWWDGDLAPGADCVDLPAIFDLFEKTDPAAPAPPVLEWTSADLAMDSRHRWVTVLRPQVYGEPVTVRAMWNAETHTAAIATVNAARMNVTPPLALAGWNLVVDGVRLDVDDRTAWLERGDGGWEPAKSRDGWKSPDRCGPLKRAFARRFALVLPTKGTNGEARETAARARLDASQWWYRANGFADVVLDTEIAADAGRFAGRNLVLYGNADTNAAWAQVFGASRPVDVRRGAVVVGERTFTTGAAACFFVRPRADDPDAVVAALADTGEAGCRLAMVHSVFTSGTGYPDYLVWDTSSLAAGDGGVLAAGYFDAAWNLDGRGHLAPAPTPPEEQK